MRASGPTGEKPNEGGGAIPRPTGETKTSGRHPPLQNNPERRKSFAHPRTLFGRAHCPDRHCGPGVRVGAADEKGPQLLGPVPLSQRKDPLLLRVGGQADFQVLRLRQGGRGHQLRHGNGEPPLPGRGGGAGQAGGAGDARRHRRSLRRSPGPPGEAIGHQQAGRPHLP